MPTILDKIVATKRIEIEAAKQRVPESQLRQSLDQAPPVRPFFDALAAEGRIKLIAEVKKASPSKGIIREDFQPQEIATIYADHGATCISVLTDESFFQGSLEYLTQIRQTVSTPLLRKDFILDSYQLVEARVAGADAVLLIAECLDDCHLRKLHNEALELGLTPLVEFYEPENLDRVLEAGATLIGVNNRDLRTFEVDLQHTVRMREKIPSECLLVGESGIHSQRDVRMLENAGVNAILVGERLMAQPDIGASVDELMK
ncbi:MAG: indole-3-glycerol phosphate synthase TrpC [Planctomycetaceae bacterium]|nr:indole-3-glycerol phosphate synthase TrpC [Planctomycetaceae bacterium]